MNSETNSVETEASEIFIPMLPSQKKRFGLMLSTAIPGAILFMSALSSSHETMGLSAIKFFSCIAGLLVIFTSIREYKIPGSSKLMGTDTITVFTGFLIIALGANMYNAYKGFQPAHGYFLAGFITIFKGVMVPEKKIKRGFTVSENEIKFKKSFLSKTRIMPVEGLNNIEFKDDRIIFSYKNSTQQHVSVHSASNGIEMVKELKELVMDVR